MSEHDAIESLEVLGLTRYEAKVLIALHRLGAGSAREVAELSDVPRPQVYSTAESLESMGLIDVQHADPIQYRPVPIEQAKTTLAGQLERAQTSAFEYIERVQQESPEEERTDIWTLSGRETISTRITHLIQETEREVLFGVHEAELVDDETAEALREVVADGVSVTILADDQALCDRFDGEEGIVVKSPPIDLLDESTGRVLIVDGNTVLLSAFGTGEEEETAIWSGETAFAHVVIRLVEQYLRASEH